MKNILCDIIFKGDNMPEINLELEVCGGCNEKIGIKDLEGILKDLKPYKREEITVGFDGRDDACVYKINEDISLVESLDFFSTMVKNPYDFGRIASTNAISDIYAMGAEPKFALNIVCFPEGENLEILKEILRGAEDICREAEVSISGGHSIHDRKIKFGQCVTGLVKNNEIWKNSGAEVGDYFILTKPLGVSLVMSAYSVGETSEENYIEAIKNMTTLNKYAAEILKKYKLSSVTDVTGFGLIGHLDECTEESVEIFADEINFLPGSYEAASDFLFTAGGERNRKALEDKVEFTFNDFALEEVLFDPQTSGGLLFAAKKDQAEKILAEMKESGIPAFYVGRVISRENKKFKVI